MKRTICLFMMFIMIATLCLVGCSNSNTNISKNVNQTIKFVDGGGTEITLPKNITKIACWSSTIESTVIGLGGCDKLVSSEYFDESHKWMYELFPRMYEIKKADSSEWNAEAMLALGVEVVLVKNAKNAEIIRNAGLTAVHLDFTTIESTMKSIEIIGKITDREDAAKKCIDTLAYYDNLVTERLASIDDSSKPVIYYNICRENTTEPVLDKTYSYGCFDTVWIEKAGGKLASESMNIGEGLVEINIEELYAANPDIIFTSGVYQEYTYADLTSGKYDDILKAVKDNKVIRVPQGIYDWGQAGVETSLVTIWCAKTLYPELFSDIDMNKITKEFYNDVMGVKVTDEQVSAILNGQNGIEGK